MYVPSTSTRKLSEGMVDLLGPPLPGRFLLVQVCASVRSAVRWCPVFLTICSLVPSDIMLGKGFLKAQMAGPDFSGGNPWFAQIGPKWSKIDFFDIISKSAHSFFPISCMKFEAYEV